MNKEVIAAIARGTESLRINTGARADANRASKRPSTELHKVNECVRLLMAAMKDDPVFAAEIDEEAKDRLWEVWLGINSALELQVMHERELRSKAQLIDPVLPEVRLRMADGEVHTLRGVVA